MGLIEPIKAEELEYWANFSTGTMHRWESQAKPKAIPKVTALVYDMALAAL